MFMVLRKDMTDPKERATLQ